MATRDEIVSKLDIKPGEWVLEIGSGPTPFYRSDILADKDMGSNSERSGALVIDRPMVICDAHFLPFTDKSFNYIFCSQVLEHLENPGQFFAEITRVGRKGYIETPNEVRERLFGWPFHRWIVDREDDQIVLKQKNIPQVFGSLFHKLQLENYEFARFCSTNFELLNTSYEWHDKVKYRFAEEDEYEIPETVDYIKSEDAGRYKLSEFYSEHSLSFVNQIPVLRTLNRLFPRLAKDSINRILKGSPHYGNRHSDAETKQYLRQILSCPNCKERIKFLEDCNSIICENCERIYEIRNGIPIFLL